MGVCQPKDGFMDKISSDSRTLTHSSHFVTFGQHLIDGFFFRLVLILGAFPNLESVQVI